MKKSQLLVVLVLFVSIISTVSYSDTFWGAVFLDYKEAKKKWGDIEFNASKFKSADEKEKGAMAANAIKIKKFVGKDMLEVRKELGVPNSYFFSDTIFAYAITESTENREAWHLIFVPDEKLEKVKEVKIHKKCCYKSPL